MKMLTESQCSTRIVSSQLVVVLRIMKMHTWGVAISYADVLTRNMRAARARKGLDQELLAARMRALGFSVWVRQTVARIEGGKRRLTAEEVLGLALALETSLIRLLEPDPDDGPIVLPSGDMMLYLTMHGLIWGGSQHTVQWDGDVPRFPVDEPKPGWTADLDEPIPPPRRRRSPNPPRYPRSGDDE